MFISPVDHKMIRIYHADTKTPCIYRGGGPNYTKRLLNARPWVEVSCKSQKNRGTFHKKFLNAFESEIPLEVGFFESGRGTTEDVFFLGDQGTRLITEGYTIQLVIHVQGL